MNSGLTCEVMIRITNVLCGVELNTHMDLKSICYTTCNSILHQGKMKCLTWRHRKIGGGKSVAVLFSNGCMTVNGNANIPAAKRNCRQFARLFQRLGYDVKFKMISILSISVCAKFPFNIKPNIEYICRVYGGEYEPELHNACQVSLNQMCVFVFPSGSINATGLRNTNEARNILKSFIHDIIMHGYES